MHVLILGGTSEARQLAGLLHGAVPDGAAPDGAVPDGAVPDGAGPGIRTIRTTSSLAGRVASPRLPPGEVRVGGFGGVAGLTEWLREQRVDVLIDATHPFAETISFNAARAAATAHVPLLALRRPGWVPGPGDDWHGVGSLTEAAALLPDLGRRIFLTTGRMGLAAFAPLDALWFLVRSVDPPDPGQPAPARMELLLERGPFSLDGERELLRDHSVDVLVTKDSGGAATAPKLVAAREAAVPVVVVRRPPVPDGVQVVETPEQAAEALAALTRSARASN